MDLALALSLPLPEMRERMTEADLYRWGKYAEQKGMPWRRIELLLAQLAMFIDMGRMKVGTQVYLTDYLVGKERTTPADRMAKEMLAFGGPGIKVQRRGK